MHDEYYMGFALEEAEIALKEGNWPIGAVIVLDNKIISRGHNQVNTLRDKRAHAEIMAIDKVHKLLFDKEVKAEIYTTYEPCPMCFGAIILNTMKRVVYGVDLDESGALHIMENMPPRFKDDYYRFDITSGVLAKECYDVFMKSRQAQKLLEKGLIKKL